MKKFIFAVICILFASAFLWPAAGDRKVVIQEIRITTGNPVPWTADWQVFVEDKAGQDRYITGGQTSGNFGAPATFNAMTGSQMRAAVKAAVQGDAKVPTNDSVN